MRIALFTETYVPEVNGVVAHVQTLKEGLEHLGHEVLVVTADKHARHHYIQDGVLHCPAAEIKRFYGFGAAPPISRKRQRMIQDFAPDIIHIHHEFGIGLSGVWASHRKKKPLVYTLHTMYDQYIYYVAPRVFLEAATKFSRKYNHFIAKKATAITGPSNKCAAYFREIGIEKELHLIPNSVDLDLFKPESISEKMKTDFRKRFSIPDNKMLVCFCGRLGQEKSVDVLIEYFAEAIRVDENIHLVIVGEGPDQEILQNLCKAMQAENHITFTGLIPHTEIPTCFAACDVYATASLSEMNSISMLEGMASGLPVLQRYDELNADQIKSGENGYLFHSSEEFSKKLQEIQAMSPEELAQLKKRVISSVTSRGATDLASYMLSVYKKALEECDPLTEKEARLA